MRIQVEWEPSCRKGVVGVGVRAFVGGDAGFELVFADVALGGLKLAGGTFEGRGEIWRGSCYPWADGIGDDGDVEVGHFAEGLVERQDDSWVD